MGIRPGIHIAFTGIDGAGKSTQSGLLAKYVRDNYGPTYLFEPRTDLVSQLMVNLAWQHGRVGRRTYFGDYAVDFAKAFDVIRDHFGTAAPLLGAGMHVISPRSAYCRLATSIGMNGKRDPRVEQVLAVIPKPDLLFWIDVEPELALERILARGIDTEDIGFLRAFCGALREMPELEEWIRIDGNQTVDVIATAIRKQIDTLFGPARRTADAVATS